MERLISVLNLGDAHVNGGDVERGFELLEEAVRLRARAPEGAKPSLEVFLEVRDAALERKGRTAEPRPGSTVPASG